MYVRWNRNLVQDRISGEYQQSASVNAAGFRADFVSSHTLNHPARSRLHNLLVGKPVAYIKVLTSVPWVLPTFCEIDTSVYNLEVRHPRCVGSITKNFVYYTYSQTHI